MKWIVSVVVLCMTVTAFGQRDLNPRNGKKMFGGAQSYKDYNLYGIQFQLGATYLMNRLNNGEQAADVSSNGFRGNYVHDPIGKLGAYAEIGMFHFPKKSIGIRFSEKTRISLFNYFDWGIGFKYFRGAEDLTVNHQDVLGNFLYAEEERFNFSHGNLYGRFSLHRHVYFKSKKKREKSKIFLDNSLGLNFDYRLLTTSDDYVFPGISSVTQAQQYYKPFHAQLHYGLGVGLSPRRGAFIIPGVRLPLLGYHAATADMGGSGDKQSYWGKPSMHWFSSRYWPVLVNVKFMYAFPKRSKGCNGAKTNDQDKETQRSR